MRSYSSHAAILVVSSILSACALLTPFQSDDTPSQAESAETDVAEIIDEAQPNNAQDQPIETATATLPPEPQSEEASPLTPAELAALTWQITSDRSGLQHLASGYICPTQIEGFALRGDQSFPELGLGNDVACIFEAPEGGSVKLHLTNFGREVSPAAHLKGVQTSITSANKNASAQIAVPTAPDTITPANAAAYKVDAISTLRPDVPVHSAVWIDRVGVWHVKARATYEADRAAPVAKLVAALYAAAEDNIFSGTHSSPPQR